jgi:hypothetical protein
LERVRGVGADVAAVLELVTVAIEGIVAEVPDSILVGVDMFRVEEVGTGIDAIVVFVTVTIVRVVARITDTVEIVVFLFGIGDRRAVVPTVRRPVVITVGKSGWLRENEDHAIGGRAEATP